MGGELGWDPYSYFATIVITEPCWIGASVTGGTIQSVVTAVLHTYFVYRSHTH